MKIKHKYCKKCDNVYEERITFWKRTKRFGIYLVFGIMVLMLVIGSTSTINFIITAVYDEPGLIFSYGGSLAFIDNVRKELQTGENGERLEQIAKDLVKGCDDDFCKAKTIFDHLDDFNYEEGNDPSPLNIWDEKEGDCDEVSYLYISLLDQLDIKTFMQCNDNHCWVIVKLDDKKIKADLTGRVGWSEYE